MKNKFKKMSIIFVMALVFLGVGFGLTGQKASAQSQTMWFFDGSSTEYQLMVWTPYGSYKLPVTMFHVK